MNKVYWIAGILIIAVTVAVIGLRQYRANHPVLPQPLSTRGLPPPATDVPVVLPPDPGEAGKATLAGIDSDHDGVRDDLQREIVYMYPQNDQIRRVLRAMVKKEQDIITTTGDHEHFKELEVSSLSFLDCYNYLAFGNSPTDHSKSNYLISLVRNTPERLQKARENSNTALPYGNPVYGTIQACTQPLVQGQY